MSSVLNCVQYHSKGYFINASDKDQLIALTLNVKSYVMVVRYTLYILHTIQKLRGDAEVQQDICFV